MKFKKIILILIIMFLLLPNYSSAKTLKDLKNELDALEKKKNENVNQKKLTQNEIKSANERIGVIATNIKKNETNITNLNGEIAVLEEKTKSKEAEIKDVIYFMQVANSENAYLEYIFNSTSIEDLILRSAISEQLVNYNDELITEYNNTIVINNEKKEKLREEIVALNSETSSLNREIVLLGDKLIDIDDASIDINKDIASQKEMIDYYVNLGCKDNDNINACVKLPYTTKLIRPVSSGVISSEWDKRVDPITGKWSMHYGTDLTGGSQNVYSAGPGIVKGKIDETGSAKNSTCGGNILLIAHNVNGQEYTTVYMHLYKMYVNIGDMVDQNTLIGLMGGDWRTPWDRCSTGTHLHFGLSIGEHSAYNEFKKYAINSRTLVNFPKGSGWWSNRTKIY